MRVFRNAFLTGKTDNNTSEGDLDIGGLIKLR
jgi:hypothetical protein